jgi:hypothetical protein
LPLERPGQRGLSGLPVAARQNSDAGTSARARRQRGGKVDHLQHAGHFQRGGRFDFATLAPITGDMRAAAYTMPSGRTSMPKTALPLTLAGVSRRGCGAAYQFEVLRRLSTTSAGVAVTAACASAP